MYPVNIHSYPSRDSLTIESLSSRSSGKWGPRTRRSKGPGLGLRSPESSSSCTAGGSGCRASPEKGQRFRSRYPRRNVPPIWINEDGQRAQTRPCPRPWCGREYPIRRYRYETLRQIGWPLYRAGGCRPKPCPWALLYQGVVVSRKKRTAFSHISFRIAVSPSVFRHAITLSA